MDKHDFGMFGSKCEKVIFVVFSLVMHAGLLYQKKYDIMSLQQHGGSYPYTSFNREGNTKVNDYCMSIGVLVKGSNAKR